MAEMNVDDILLDMHDDGELDDEEVLLLMHENQHRNLHANLLFEKYDRFDVEFYTEEEFEVEFRFHKRDINRLAAAFQLPDSFKCANGVIVDGVEALCVTLKRVAYPCRYADIVPRFGRPVSQICMVTNLMIDFLHDRFGNLLRDIDHPMLSPRQLQIFANAVHNKGAALNNCWGFIDGTVRPICRPNQNQRAVYNGHKRVHAIKFQSVVCPNGIIANLFGPVDGRRHDSAMLQISGLLDQLEDQLQ